MGKLYKLVRLTRLLRIMKLVKEKGKLMKFINKFLKVGGGFERLFFFFLILILAIHIISCLWVIVAIMYAEDMKGTWIEATNMTKKSVTERYIIALYWSVTTITTVGYGDISGTNIAERVFMSFMMLAGVISFSIANGALASIIQNYDQSNAEYEERI